MLSCHKELFAIATQCKVRSRLQEGRPESSKSVAQRGGSIFLLLTKVSPRECWVIAKLPWLTGLWLAGSPSSQSSEDSSNFGLRHFLPSYAVFQRVLIPCQSAQVTGTGTKSVHAPSWWRLVLLMERCQRKHSHCCCYFNACSTLQRTRAADYFFSWLGMCSMLSNNRSIENIHGGEPLATQRGKLGSHMPLESSELGLSSRLAALKWVCWLSPYRATGSLIVLPFVCRTVWITYKDTEAY